jgi:glycosyltransferase involved in cell wall biosynthesis/Flp pilus assembly protein TadD
MGKKWKKGRTKKAKPGKPTISACMIVKDEEELLPRCLRSIENAVDEIIVVDTGSSDRTVEIAENVGAKVYHHPWENNFSKHRNQSISYASGDWIFVLDADEELVSEDIPRLSRAVQDPSIDAIMVTVVSKLRGGQSVGVHCVERIFRNNGIIHYEGRIHNRLVKIKDAKVFPIKVLHCGYALDSEASKKNFKRTVSLLRLDLEEVPNNPMTYHYLGCSYLTQGMFRESYEASKKAIDLASAKNDPNLIYLWSHYNVAMSCYRLKNLKEAEAFCLACLERYPNHVDSHFVLTLIYFDQELWDRVVSHGSKYLKLVDLQHKDPGAFGNLVMNSLGERWNIAALMGMAHSQLKEEEKAENSFEEAMCWALEPFLVARAAGVFFYNRGLLQKARAFLEKSMDKHEGDETTRRLLNEIMARMGKAGKDPSISCCMIVRNEEAFLEQCLKSVKNYVDEIVIVDTGSTDGTVEIARRYTDKVYFHPWEGSFSMARNQASSYASGDWIFIIDADEELVQRSGEKLRLTVAKAGNADAFHVNTISTYSNGARRARHNSERLFRNNGVIRYEGIVHNRVVGARSVKASQIEIMHYGYDVDEKKAHEKFLRTTGLLKKQIAEESNNPMPHHYLGVSYLSRGMNEEAARESVTAIELAEMKGDEHPLYIWARHIAAMALFRMGDLDKAEDYSLGALRKYADHLDSYYMLAVIAGERSEWENVLSYGERYLQLRDVFEKNPEKAGLVINSAMNEAPAVHLLIGHAKYSSGEISRMEREYRLAADLSEDQWQAWWNAGCFHLDRTGDLNRAEQYLAKALKESADQREVFYMLAKLHNKKGAIDVERRCLEKLLDLDTEDPVVLKRLSTLYLESGQRELGRKVLTKTIELDPSNYTALCSLGRIHQEKGEFHDAVDFFKKALEYHPQRPESWMHLGEISLELDQLSEARDFFEHVLSLQPNDLGALLCLCEIELKENRIIEFVNTCDRILKELQLDRDRTIEGLPDMVDVLEEVREAVKESPRLETQAEKVMALLRSRIREFDEAIGQGESRNAIDSSAPAY